MFVRLPCGGVGVSTVQLQGEVLHHNTDTQVFKIVGLKCFYWNEYKTSKKAIV